MTVTKANADVLDLTDAYAFSGAVSGAGDAGGYEFVSAVTASTSATVAFTTMAAGYDYRVDMVGVGPDTNASSYYAQLGVAGVTYRTSGYIGTCTTEVPTSSTNTIVPTGNIGLSAVNLSGTNTDESFAISMTIFDPMAAGTDTYVTYHGFYRNSNAAIGVIQGGAIYTTAEAHPAIKFYYSSGNVLAGFFKLYRRPNA